MAQIPYCGECSFFKYEDTYGQGVCDIKGRITFCERQCDIHYLTLTERQALRILHHFQKYRRGGKKPMPQPYIIGQAIDKAIRTLRERRTKQ